jgi:hypothetical protein
MYSSYYGQILRRFIKTADSSLPATTETELSNQSNLDALSSNSELQENINPPLPPSSSKDSKQSWIRKALNLIQKSSQN